MMHNFLAESIDFFLRKGECTKIVSKPSGQWKPMVPGQPYGMRIKMYRSTEGAKPPTGSWGEYPVPQNLSGTVNTNFTIIDLPLWSSCGGAF